MKKQLVVVTMSMLLYAEFAYATCNQAMSDDSHCSAISDPAQNIAHCESYTFSFPLCYKNASGTYNKFNLCNKCEDGYILTLNPDFVAMGCDNSDGGVYVCQPCSVAKSCNPNAGVEYNPDGWKNSWTGYQSNSWTECNTNTCEWEAVTEYRCAAGYFGPSSGIKEKYIEGFGVAGLTGCSLCPLSNSAKYAQSDAGENETIEGCYMVEDEGYDFTGSYKIIPAGTPCYYEND